MQRTRVALFEFMPYGAPELIEAGDRHLTRALSTAMAGIGALFALALAAAALAPQHASPALPTFDLGHVLQPPPLVPAAPRIAAPAAPAPPAAHATPLPVPDAMAPVARPEVSSAPATGGEATGTGTPATDEPSTATGPAAPAAPALDNWVYVDSPPAVATRVLPVYPDFAREAGVEGTVRARVLVGLDGRVVDVHVDRSVPMLDEAAVSALRKWVFTPALANGHPVMVWVAVPVAFRLH